METGIDYSPDHRPSSSALEVGNTDDGGVRMVLVVRGLGVIILRASSDWKDPSGRLKFNGCSTFTRTEIGFSEKLP